MNSNQTLMAKLRVVIVELKAKQKMSNEIIIDEYIKRYEVVIKRLSENPHDKLLEADFSSIRTLGRAYLENSSNYQQAFLYAMADAEQAIRDYLHHE